MRAFLISFPSLIFIFPRHKSLQMQTPGKPSTKAAVTALWGSAALDNVVDLDVSFDVEVEKSVVKRLQM